MSIFQQYSDYYDLFYPDKAYKKEADYVYKTISRFSEEPLRPGFAGLNLGCGTGNHDFALLKHGMQLTSVDSSAQFIRIADLKKQENELTDKQIKFVHSDIRKLKLNKKFDCAIALFHVINYLNSNKDLSECFKSVNKHLKKDGLFLFDSWYGPAVLHDLPGERTKMAASGKNKIERKSYPTLYPNENIAEIDFQFRVLNGKNKIVRRFSEIHKMRYLFYPELKMLLEMSGFGIIHSEEWMTGRPIGLNSWYVLFVAKKI